MSGKAGFVAARTVDLALTLAAKGADVTLRDIRKESGLGIQSIQSFLMQCRTIPWLTITRCESGKMTFDVNEELKQLCDLHKRRPELDGRSLDQFYKDMRKEITARRKANHDERMKRNWNPENVVRRFQSELLDWIEEQLDLVTTVRRPRCMTNKKLPHSGKEIINVVSENQG
jgi:hypothetical protein